MLAYTYIEKGKFALVEKPKPTLIEPTDAIVRVTMSSICSSDLHIKHGSVPRAVPGITVGHEMVGVVEAVGAEVLRLIEQGKIDTTPLITHRFPLNEIEETYRVFENKLDGVIKVAITNNGER